MTGTYAGAGIGVTAWAVGAVTGICLYEIGRRTGCVENRVVETLTVDGLGAGGCAKPASFAGPGPGVIEGSGRG